MAKRHQNRRRRAYGPRQHEVHERRARRREPDLQRWLAVADDARSVEAIGLGGKAFAFGPWLGRDLDALPLGGVD